MKRPEERKIPWFNPELPKAVYDWQVLQYLLSKCVPADNGCLIYTGFMRAPPRNYGEISYRGGKWRTHRLAYHLTQGEIPDGMVVMHSCDTPPCCNPAHLKLGTHLENMTDCRAKGRYYYANLTHCKRGHEFNEQNTYIIQTPGEAFGLRQCKACNRLKQRALYQKPEYRARRLTLQRERRARLKAQQVPTTGDRRAD